MITKHEYKDMVWVDVESPIQEEVRKLMEEYDIDLHVADELLSSSIKPKIELFENYIYMILHFPVSKHTYTSNNNQEVDFIIGKKFFITIRYDTIDTFYKFSKDFEVNVDLEKDNFGDHSGFIFYYLSKEIYKSVANELEYSSSLIKNIEEKIFSGKEKEMVKEISQTGRVLLDFKQAISPHKNILDSLEEMSEKLFGVQYRNYIRDIASDHYRILSNIERNKETLYQLRETNNSLLSTKQNEVMKVLTIMAFATFPLSLIAGIFGMNTVSTPILGQENDFWIVLGIMAIMTLLFFVFFKSKKWL